LFRFHEKAIFKRSHILIIAIRGGNVNNFVSLRGRLSIPMSQARRPQAALW
jgi:hypothetical protein